MFSLHPKHIFWADRNKNSPDEVPLNTHKKFWFDCECGHQFERQLNEVNRGNWCPYCANKKLCEKTKNCKMCFEKSFASLEYSVNWSIQNETNPYECLKKSHKKYLFDCPKCVHTFSQKLSHITRGNTCMYCCNRTLCNNTLNCKSCYDKTFASIDKSSFWSKKNKLNPNEVFKNTATKYWFQCDKCNNDFESKLCHITYGSWCPKCRYKTEDKMYKILNELYPSIISQYKVDWCKNKKHLPFDFAIEEMKLIIELDGEAHFRQIAKWKSPEHTRQRDLYKMKCANKNGFSVIRILQEDVLYNRYEWLNELTHNIEKVKGENKVQNIYMCKNSEYKDFVLLN
jgi:very-short-patch-repair endonuclease